MCERRGVEEGLAEGNEGEEAERSLCLVRKHSERTGRKAYHSDAQVYPPRS